VAGGGESRWAGGRIGGAAYLDLINHGVLWIHDLEEGMLDLGMERSIHVVPGADLGGDGEIRAEMEGEKSLAREILRRGWFCGQGPHTQKDIGADVVGTEELRHRCPITGLNFFEHS